LTQNPATEFINSFSLHHNCRFGLAGKSH